MFFDKKKETPTYIGATEPKKKSHPRQWISDLIFLFIVIPLVNIFVIQSYAIPTSSMEGSMLVGDKLFVSKFHFGARIPQTPLSFPFVHNTLPVLNTKSYIGGLQLPYMRLPGFSPLKRNDIVVFNWPEGDTVTTRYQSQISYHQIVREIGKQQTLQQLDITTYPVDKRENYVKRCVAVGGDSIKIVEGVLYVNGQPAEKKALQQTSYFVQTDGTPLNEKRLREYGVTEMPRAEKGGFLMHLNEKSLEKVKSISTVKSITPIVEVPGQKDAQVFPYIDSLLWNRDNFGPLYIPKKGDQIQLTPLNCAIYGRTIKVFENNPTFECKNGQAFLDGKPLASYTFKMNYYWMMGDNRHNSQDARMWGFVPEDHIVGKPIFVWLSTEDVAPNNGKGFMKKLLTGEIRIRWNKTFRIPE